MPTWSKYSTLFHSERFGYFLYSTMSNCLLQVDEPHYRFLQQLEMEPSVADNGFDTSFISLLKAKHILVERGENEKLLMLKQYKKNCNCYGQKDLSLTICPTLACNFDCSYCFENSQHDTTVMSEETIENLLAFIRKKSGVGNIHIDWYGGEPTLAFDTVELISNKMLAKGMKLHDAQMTTNGFLLDIKKIKALNDLKINSIQITLDGPKTVHDRRRKLHDGRPTFEKVLANIDQLMSSSYKGKCDIRVNIDKNNRECFPALREKLMKRYKGKKVTVYPARVKGEESSTLNTGEWAKYCLDLYEKYGIITKHMLYPKSNDTGLCIAHFTNSFVSGPSGELYKCWEDVGMREKTIGNVNSDEPLSNHELPVLYTVGTDQYANEECRKCCFLPICRNACPRKQLSKTETCTHFKQYIVQCMESTYDIFKTAETSCDLLNKPFETLENKGYRIIYPSDNE